MIGADRLQTMEIHSENTFGIWSAPERPFGIEYSTRVLDDIRLAVTDAFFSLPRGGAEIGGVLLGTEENGRVAITESVPLPCEHAYGPSFVLSPRDHVSLTELLAELKTKPKSIPVGWWHSHTRSEIFLSDADQEIHNRFFPEPWQVALVLKPHTFHPMRAGFFFREKDGSIRGASSYREFVLDALPMRAVPSSPAGPPAAPALSRPTKPNGSVITVAPQTIEPLPPRDAALPERSETPPPKFLADEPAPSRRRLLWVAAVAGLGIGAAAFGTRDSWLPLFQSAAPARLALNATDLDGQLQIRWDGASPAVRQASGGALVIADGPMPLIIPLDPAHLQSGSLTYGRKGDRVDVTLTVSLGGGRDVREATAFAGSAPSHSSASSGTGADVAIRAERDRLAAENERLKADYGRQVLRTKQLETGLEDLRKVVQRDQQRKRLEAQVPDSAK
jgi:proteasome lid subunit RPN8/RPN11